jgi:hypothetical protein
MIVKQRIVLCAGRLKAVVIFITAIPGTQELSMAKAVRFVP